VHARGARAPSHASDTRSTTRQMGSAAVEMQRGERASLLFGVRSVDPRRPTVKEHNM